MINADFKEKTGADLQGWHRFQTNGFGPDYRVATVAVVLLLPLLPAIFTARIRKEYLVVPTMPRDTFTTAVDVAALIPMTEVQLPPLLDEY